MCKNGTHINARTVSQIPEDAKCVRATYDPERDMLFLVFEHPSFLKVLPGAVIPITVPTFVAGR